MGSPVPFRQKESICFICSPWVNPDSYLQRAEEGEKRLVWRWCFGLEGNRYAVRAFAAKLSITLAETC